MCRGKISCDVLGVDPSKWDKNCPLRTRVAYDDAVDMFVEAVRLYEQGKRNESLALLEKIDNLGITEWYIEHGQMSGLYRDRVINLKLGDKLLIEDRYPVRSPARLQNEVFRRDGYRCRYCRNRLIDQGFLKNFAKKINSPVFVRGSSNLTSHAIIHLTWPVADHVIPWSRGGATTLDNLVASCAPCNYGKADYTIEQLGISNPFDRKPVVDTWDGLSRCLL